MYVPYVNAVDEAGARAMVAAYGAGERLTDRHEGGRDDRWRVTDAPADFVEGMLKAVVGVELRVERVEAKAKLSQNRSEPDRRGVIEGLGEHPVAEAMRRADPGFACGAPSR